MRLTGSRDLDDKHRSLEVAGSDLKKKKVKVVTFSNGADEAEDKPETFNLPERRSGQRLV